MHLFLFLAIPCILFWYALSSKNYKIHNFALVSLSGFLIGALACSVYEFFIFTSHIWTLNFISNYCYLLLKESLVPTLVISAVFMLLAFKSDSMDFKTSALVPLVLSYYIVSVPYSVMTSYTKSVFLCFVKPVLFASMVVLAGYFFKKAMEVLSANKNKAITFFAVTFVSLLIPSLVEAMWYVNALPVLMGCICAVYIASPIALYTTEKLGLLKI